jgi:hypothetical protein
VFLKCTLLNKFQRHELVIFMRNNPINPGKLNTRSILRPFVLCIVYLTNEERRGSVTLHVAAEDVKLDFGCDAQPVF